MEQRLQMREANVFQGRKIPQCLGQRVYRRGAQYRQVSTAREQPKTEHAHRKRHNKPAPWHETPLGLLPTTWKSGFRSHALWLFLTHSWRPRTRYLTTTQIQVAIKASKLMPTNVRMLRCRRRLLPSTCSGRHQRAKNEVGRGGGTMTRSSVEYWHIAGYQSRAEVSDSRRHNIHKKIEHIQVSPALVFVHALCVRCRASKSANHVRSRITTHKNGMASDLLT